MKVSHFIEAGARISTNRPWRKPKDEYEADPEDFPRTTNAIKKFGAEVVFEALELINEWHGGGSTKIVNLIPVIKAISPPSPIPKVLYRGLKRLLPQPRIGQPVTYTTKKPWSSWTSDKYIALHDFCGPNGLLLQALGSDMAHQTLLTWPMNREIEKLAHDYAEYAQEEEWGFKLKSPIPIVAWWRCDQTPGYPVKKPSKKHFEL